MSFAKELDHLRAALDNPPRGYTRGFTRVRLKALDELLFHFDRLDEESRQRHQADADK